MRMFFRIITVVFLSFTVGYFWIGGLHRVNQTVPVVIQESKATEQEPTITKETSSIQQVLLKVPYISEAPEGDWTGDWVNACEEASLSMVDSFYSGQVTVSIPEAKEKLTILFEKENMLYGSNKNADAAQIQELASKYLHFKTERRDNPTIDEIKEEIRAGHPVISLHKGFDLQNKNIPFSPTLSSYHVLVIVGFDDIKGEFITNDPGDDGDGFHHAYTYKVFMNSLHGYDTRTDTTDGAPVVIFTSREK